MRDVEVVILAGSAAEQGEASDDGRVGAVTRRASRVAVDDRGESLRGEAPPQPLHLSECQAEQLCGIEGGELTGTQAGQDFSAALLSRAQGKCPHTKKYDDIIAEQLSATFSLSSNKLTKNI